jgi:hypothetical protein
MIDTEGRAKKPAFGRTVMSLKARSFAPLLVATGCAASIAFAPHAAADQPWPPVGQSPIEAINYFTGEGYFVAVNWTRGIPDVPLYECTLVGIHNPDGTGPTYNTTVYLDISCPPSNLD